MDFLKLLVSIGLIAWGVAHAGTSLMAQGTDREATQEVAAVAVMRAADESGCMTGAEINIDGGIPAGSPSVVKGQ